MRIFHIVMNLTNNVCVFSLCYVPIKLSVRIFSLLRTYQIKCAYFLFVTHLSNTVCVFSLCYAPIKLSVRIFSLLRTYQIKDVLFSQLLRLQSILNTSILEATKVMFDDMDNIDVLVTNIMTFAKTLVSAERCGLFLVDRNT